PPLRRTETAGCVRRSIGLSPGAPRPIVPTDTRGRRTWRRPEGRPLPRGRVRVTHPRGTCPGWAAGWTTTSTRLPDGRRQLLDGRGALLPSCYQPGVIQHHRA